MKTITSANSIAPFRHEKQRKREPITEKDVAAAADAIAGDLTALAGNLRSNIGSLPAVQLDRALQKLAVLGVAIGRVVRFVEDAQAKQRKEAPTAGFSADARGQDRKRRMLASTGTGQAVLNETEEGRQYLKDRRRNR